LVSLSFKYRFSFFPTTLSVDFNVIMERFLVVNYHIMVNPADFCFLADDSFNSLKNV